ncbi:MAG TPA: hypothetical protein VHF67_09780 [Gaiellaceae bacterium]|nr:hypothetical protein [Gaiellaceae bacterium]
MQKHARLVLAFALAALALPGVAWAGHTADPRSPNLVPLGHIEEPRLAVGTGVPYAQFHSDIAFQGRFAYQGTWGGFNIRDISDPSAPSQVSFTACEGNQGDVVVYRNILVRSWNTGAGTPGLFGATLTCDGVPVAPGFEGLHVFDISNPANPTLVAQVATLCGSHTATAVPDPANNRLLIYNSPSSGGTNPPANAGAGTGSCAGISIVEVPLSAPATARVLRHELLTGSVTVGTASVAWQCHDTSVFIEKNLVACAGGPGMSVWSIGGASGGTLEDPALLYQRVVPTVTVGHSASFSWNGEIIIFGWEPGGGVIAECEATDDPLKRSFFFYRASDGSLLGTWTLPRPQTSSENCTLHNYNVAPFLDRHVLVHGSYQAGTGVIDFTSPSAPQEVAWSDPPPRPVPPGGPFPCCDLSGNWSSYWYNDLIYDTHIGEGLNIWRLAEPWATRALSLDRLNPQTQVEAMDCTVRTTGRLRARRHTMFTVRVRVWAQGAPAVRVRLVGGGLERSVRTNASGVATTHLRPRRAGTLRVQVPDTLNMEGCRTSARIAAAPRRGGLAPGGAGALTGRPA